MGLFDIFGSVDTAQTSGAFRDLPGVGQAVGNLLLDRLQTPTTERDEFKLGVGAIQDEVSRSGATARQRLGDSASAGGFLDSGAIDLANLGIARAETSALSGAIRDLILGFEDQKVGQAFPFLGMGTQESTAIQGMNLQSQLQQRQMAMSFTSDMIGNFAPFKFGGGSPLDEIDPFSE